MLDLKALLELLQAMANGQPIQRFDGSGWKDCALPDPRDIAANPDRYRIRSDPQYEDHEKAIQEAFASGKTIQFEYAAGWRDVTEIPQYRIAAFPYRYRIKPEPLFRPWTADEVPVGAQARIIGKKHVYLITSSSGAVMTSTGQCSLECMLAQWEWKWGHETEWKPCGVPV